MRVQSGQRGSATVPVPRRSACPGRPAASAPGRPGPAAPAAPGTAPGRPGSGQPWREELALRRGEPAGSLVGQVEGYADRARPAGHRVTVEQLVPDDEPARPDVLDPQLDPYRVDVVHRPQVVHLV